MRIMKRPTVLNFVRLHTAGEIQKLHWSIFWKTLFWRIVGSVWGKAQRKIPWRNENCSCQAMIPSKIVPDLTNSCMERLYF
jgi:hypothetical protein